MPKILVTGVGGGVGQSVVKALQDSPYGLVGVDSDELAAGLYGTPSGYIGRYAVDPHFVDRLIEICDIEKCSLIFPGHDVELLPLAENAARFAAVGVVTVVSTPEVVRLCDDKLEANTFLRSQGFAVPQTWPLRESPAIPSFPVVLKPQRGGARSRNTYVARNAAELSLFRQLVDNDNCVVQEYIDGEEYTCGTVTLGGKCVGAIVMRRTLRTGDTYKAFVEDNPRIETVVRDVVGALKPFGACNVQLRVMHGEPYIFEINARCSGTTAARALAGFNEPKLIADYLLADIEPVYSIRVISVLRYWKELVVTNDRIEELASTNHILGNGIKL